MSTEELMKGESETPICPPPYSEFEPKEGPVPIPSAAHMYSLVQPPLHNIQPVVVPPQPGNLQQCSVTVRGGGTMYQPVGKKRATLFCQTCGSQIKTKTDTSYTCCTHFCCLLLCATGVFCPLIFLPYCCCDPAKVVHTCPNCKAMIGTYYG